MYLARTVKLKRQKMPNIGEDVEQLEISRAARARLNVASTLEVPLGVSGEAKRADYLWATNPLPGTCSTEMHTSMHEKHVKDSYGGVTCKRQNMEGTQIPINRGMNKP